MTTKISIRSRKGIRLLVFPNISSILLPLLGCAQTVKTQKLFPFSKSHPLGCSAQFIVLWEFIKKFDILTPFFEISANFQNILHMKYLISPYQHALGSNILWGSFTNHVDKMRLVGGGQMSTIVHMRQVGCVLRNRFVFEGSTQ